jgi:hypothetical protein
VAARSRRRSRPGRAMKRSAPFRARYHCSKTWTVRRWGGDARYTGSDMVRTPPSVRRVHGRGASRRLTVETGSKCRGIPQDRARRRSGDPARLRQLLVRADALVLRSRPVPQSRSRKAAARRRGPGARQTHRLVRGRPGSQAGRGGRGRLQDVRRPDRANEQLHQRDPPDAGEARARVHPPRRGRDALGQRRAPRLLVR